MICDITNFGTPLSARLVWKYNKTAHQESASAECQQSAEVAHKRPESEDEA
jgi:hypothetical protein